MEHLQFKNNTTKKNYIKNALRLKRKAFIESTDINKSVAEKGYFTEIDNNKQKVLPTLYTAGWALKYWSNNYKKNTWRQYRASLIFYAELELKNKKIDIQEYEKIKKIMKSTSGGNKKELPIRTSAQKKKNINEKDFKIIDKALNESNNRWSNATRIWLRSGILTGLRPIEWQKAEIKDNKYLIVYNAKNTNGRAHGETRTLSLEHLNKNELQIIKEQIKTSQKFYKNNLWKNYYIGCSNILRYTSRKVFKYRKKYPTLYTGRHQYSADLKAIGCTSSEIAALMGHSSDLTNQIHYGKRRYGNTKVKPNINKNDLKNVKVKIKKSTFKFQ